jgi:hypothetical protein
MNIRIVYDVNRLIDLHIQCLIYVDKNFNYLYSASLKLINTVFTGKHNFGENCFDTI